MPALGPHAPRSDAKPKSRPKPKVRRPSASSRARAQEQAYKSQGRAVEKQANTQRRARVRRQHEAKDTKGAGDMGRARKYIQSKYKDKRAVKLVEKTIGHPVAAEPDVTGREYRRKQKEAKEASIAKAPVGRVLEQTTRPVHGVMGGIRAAERGENVLKAAKRGVQNKDKYTASDVLSEAGWNPKGGLGKALKGAASLVADVGLDPTTYASGGVGSVTRKTALKSAEQATKKATAKGLSHEQAQKFGERALRKAMKGAKDEKGAVVRFAGKEVPGVRKATAVATRPVRAAVRRAPGRKGVRSVAADVNPNITPVGATKEAHMASVQATRAARAKVSHGIHESREQAKGIKAKIGDDNYQRVVDAIEAGNIKSLPEELRPHAIYLRSQFRYANRLRKQAGIKGGEKKNYVPHPLTPEGLAKVETEGVARKGMGKAFYSKARKRNEPMAKLREKFPGDYEQDLAKVFHERMATGKRDVAFAELNRDLAGIGRDAKKGKALNLQEGEALFHIKGGAEPRLVTDKKELARLQAPLVLNKKGTKVKNATPKSVGGGRYVVLNKEVVKRAVEGRNPEMQGPGIVKAYDTVQAGFKTLAIGTPGFHVRNFIGDMSNAYLGQGGHKLAGNLGRARRVLKAYGRQEKALQNLTPAQVGQATLKTGRYGHVTYDEVARNLRDAGAFRSGFIARELPELTDKRIKAPEKLRRAALAREDLPRLTTAMEALRQGATWKEAAEAVSKLHFDYQHLTQFERQIARRAMPFYTWSARNIPLQARMVVARPGKYAQFQKVREEAVKSSGAEDKANEAADYYEQLEALGVKLPKDWQKGLSEWEQRNASIPVTIGGKTFTVSAGLPLQDLNEFPGAALSKQLEEYYQKGMSLTGPLPKDLIEYFDNHSFFFRDQLERDNSPLVPAPAYAEKLPAWLKKAAWVHEIKDKRTGKMVLSWRGKADYLVKTIPGTPQYLQTLATQSDRRGRTAAQKLMGWAGVRSAPYDPLTNAINLAYAEMQKTEKELNAIRQQGFGKDNPSAEWRAKSDKLKALQQLVYSGKAERKDAVLPRTGAPPKSKGGVKWNDGGGGVKWSDQQSGVKWTD